MRIMSEITQHPISQLIKHWVVAMDACKVVTDKKEPNKWIHMTTDY